MTSAEREELGGVTLAGSGQGHATPRRCLCRTAGVSTTAASAWRGGDIGLRGDWCARIGEVAHIVVGVERHRDAALDRRIVPVRRDRAVRYLRIAIHCEYLSFGPAFEDVPQREYDDLVRHDDHALAGIVAEHCVDDSPHPQDDVRPALASGRPLVKLAQPARGSALDRENAP